MESVNEIKKIILKEIAASQDLVVHPLQSGKFQVELIYISSICDSDRIQQAIVVPYLKSPDDQQFTVVLESNPGCEQAHHANELIPRILRGNVIVLLINADKCFIFNAIKNLTKDPSEDTTETTVNGPRLALSEYIETNVNLIRQRYPSPHLQMDEQFVGAISHTKLALLYDKTLVNPDLLEEIKKKLTTVKVDILQSAGQLQRIIDGHKYSLFPKMMITERPDRIALNLSHGKTVILVQGNPYAVIIPAIFFDFLTAMDDIYHTFWVSRGQLILRYFALFITVVLPALYITIVSYNPEILRVQFTFSIAGSRAEVPYPSYIEVCIMLFFIEGLIEASIRLPKYIGGTATTVGGLILGQAAQQAGLVSSIMVIVTSAITIANFVIPINAMAFAVRLLKYPLVLLSIFFGLIGITTGLFAIIVYISSLRSFGEPYFRLFAGEKSSSGTKRVGEAP